jgi:hypothetical protein
MAQLTTSPITPKMFRHFAAVTIVVTLLLAVFADGENREAITDGVSDGIAARQESERVEQAQVAKFGQPKLFARTPSRRASGGGGYEGGDGFDGSYGSPTDRTGQYARTTAVWRGRVDPNAAVPGSYARYGIPQAEWDRMSEAEREEYLRARMPAKPPVSATQHRREVEGLLAASAARAGEGDAEGD